MLVIDLQGALLRSDLGLEALFSDPGKTLRHLRDIRSWRMSELSQLVADAEVDYASLPYDQDVLNQALAARARGEKIYLVADSIADHAAGIASHLGFDGVVAPADLVAGALPFAPDSIARISSQNGRSRASLKTWANALRVYQYAKNTLVFVPAVTAHQMSLSALGYALLAFLAFSACASGAYLMNDLLDLAADRQHPTKRHRALAAGTLPIAHALIAIPALWLFAVAASLCISGLFVAVLGAYLATTIAYSLVLKRKMLVDVVTLAGLYSLRIIAGAVAVGVVLSEWLLMFSLFVFTSLALIKRFSELSMRQGAGLADPANRDYRISDLSVIAAMAAASGMNAVIVFSLYVSSSTVATLYSRPWMLWLLNPLLLYWFGRALMMAHRREMPDDPILYTFRDGASRITVAAMICIMLAAI
ncbi:UbiA family prenyltransferase [Bradyrhizobium liaoningense]|uniref:UbiA family prenyltransferase n=1 Tax=Bradyrhizobium liaoningense TaxID=43992 RepID=UPI002898341E|nr:UbiA family prenyltransferase [Bradyrhizobium liaoningense]